jgi:DNA-binding NarL/FixJ family response regulator
MNGQVITVAVVDDHSLFRNGLSLLLQHDRRIKVVGEGANGAEALELARGMSPDVMLLDVEMGEDSAESVISRIIRAAPALRVIVLTMHRDSVLRRQLVRAGAADYVTKDIDCSELVDRIVLVVSQAQGGPAKAPPGELGSGRLLSERELQVLRMVGLARSNREIGESLSIAEGTVKRHATHIFAKLGARSRIDAVRKANRLGLL